MGQPATKRDVVVQLKLPRNRRIRGHVTGYIVGSDERGALVDYPGNSHGPLHARTTVNLDKLVESGASTLQRAVLLVFEHERSDQPIVVGLLEPSAVRDPALTAAATPRAKDADPKPVGVRVDGQRVVLEAADEIVLQCGEASITLRRNGRVVIRGAYVETRSRGVNRIKGGSVQIN